MTRVHLVGSVNLADVPAVFETCSREIGSILPRLPDGEVGRPFVQWLMAKLVAHPAIEVEEGGSMGGLLPRLHLRRDFGGELDFGPFGFAAAAKESFATFDDLQRRGVIDAATRFQVSIPSAMTIAIVPSAIADQQAINDAVLRSLLGEIEELAAAIPHAKLAIQFDLPAEIAILEGVFPAWFGVDMAPIEDQVRRLAAAVPAGVELGFHLCYGDPPPEEGKRGRHLVEPRDMALLVALANAVADAVERDIDWMHMPVPMARDDEAYFAPLRDLRLAASTELFLGLIHDADGITGAQRRIAAARAFRRDFGVATECGLGRLQQGEIPALLGLHRQVAAAVE